MAISRTVDVTAFIDRHRVSRFQTLIVSLCFLIVAIDGFDTAAIGFIAPVLHVQWQLQPAQLAPLFGAGLAGLMVGALAFGPFGDRVGRKRLLLVCVCAFGLASLISAFAPSLGVLIALRFLTGLGLGGAMPNAITLTSEFCPSPRRSFLVTTMFCGFTIGSALGGFAAAALIEHYGWRSVLFVGGIVPIALVPILAWRLPESVRYLASRGEHRERIERTLARIAPDADLAGATFTTSGAKASGSPVGHLFRPELLRGTLLMWLAFFMSLLVIYLLSSWLPTLLRTTGASLRTAALVTAMFQVGGTLGAIVLGWLMDRLNPCYVLGASYAAAGVFTAAIGSLTATPWLAAIAVFLAGFCVSGSQVGANAFSAAFYPTDCRATGVSWANGIGRLGSVVGSVAGGAMLSTGLTLPSVFMIVGVPAVVAGIAMTALGRWRRQANLAPQDELLLSGE
ncbi:aromatic acid/H+ symport family MFS transporter [Paraburkholderia sp. CNPSo 3076]|uniref:MFS transporter n=1 Tax=Paraburkholderia sp. CNPSo 3076 TaxID=2940936 RepID=UPI0022551D37|nr:aromatic acid/H+ symport family MFS transporter [Paraburkholderia sp. CNPSo 3076]MCX5543084.1 aromatic acid/H+ symport family MFS transporter [Paraburkholderia sp. CNPSo 3076]